MDDAGETLVSLRRGALLWASFLGASASFATMLMLPAAWYEPGASLAELSALFLIGWGLALVPAVIAALLMKPPPGRR